MVISCDIHVLAGKVLFRWLIPQLKFPMPRHLPPFRGLPPTHGRHWPLQLICDDLWDLLWPWLRSQKRVVWICLLNKSLKNRPTSGYCASKGVLHAGTKPCLFAARQVPELVSLSPMIHCSFFQGITLSSNLRIAATMVTASNFGGWSS